MINQVEYIYKNAPILGGGYVTGFVFHKKQAGILYARTDIGGVYRYDYDKKYWNSLIDHVTMEDLSETYPIACALDDAHPERLYIVSGINGKNEGKFSVSEDYGNSFIHYSIPTLVHGNLCGRGTGFRLVVDKTNSDRLYYASQLGGLYRTENRGKTWEKLSLPEDYTTFVWALEEQQMIVVGTAGYTTRKSEKLRGHSLYVSYDNGATFEPLMEPESVIIPDSKMNGLVAARYDYDGTYLYITFNATGRSNYIVDLGYSCDSGDTIGGKVLRYYFKDGRIAGYDDITPDVDKVARENTIHTNIVTISDGNRTQSISCDSEKEFLNYGFGGISSCQSKPGLLVCSTLYREKYDAECIYLSRDYGNTWNISLKGLEEGNIYFRTSYMKPEFNAGASILHWMSDIKINPFNPNEIWVNSGTGVFTSDALLSDNPAYHDWCDGIEETVHLNVYGPVAGEVQLIDIVGDLGGFAFRDLEQPCKNSFDDDQGNRYITCINADVSDTDSSLGIVTARGNWKGKTKGGLIITRDEFHTFERIPMPYGINEQIDQSLSQIEHPNVNPGWVAMSQNGKGIVWSIADGIRLPVDKVVVSADSGKSFRKSTIYDLQNNEVEKGFFKPFSDRVNNHIFYGFGETSQFYISTDGGLNFYEKTPVFLGDRDGNCIEQLPVCDFGYIDTANKSEIRGEGGKEGVFYIATGKNGLWKMIYNVEQDKIELYKLSKRDDVCYKMGLGKGTSDKEYLQEDQKTIYMSGIIEGQYGFYRTLDECRTFERLNNDKQFFGEIISVDGDKRVFGRFFLATGSRGVMYGEPCKG